MIKPPKTPPLSNVDLATPDCNLDDIIARGWSQIIIAAFRAGIMKGLQVGCEEVSERDHTFYFQGRAYDTFEELQKAVVNHYVKR